MRFRILRGLHVGPDGQFYGPRDQHGKLGPNVVSDEIETKVDLVKKHGPIKFKRIYDPPEPVDEFDGMKVKELEKYARDNEIDIGMARTKKEILEAIRGVPELADNEPVKDA